MANINSNYGQRTYQPTITSLNPGLSLGSGDDFLSSRSIGNIGSGFVGSIRPTTSSSRYILNPGSPYSHNATPSEILLSTTSFVQGISTQTSNNPVNLVRLPYVNYPYFQGVPNIGINPNAAKILSATTQFQSELETVGPNAIPGYPNIGFGSNPDALDFMGATQSFTNAMIPYQPGAQGQGAFYPGAFGGGQYYPTPTIQPPYNYSRFQPTNYPRFSPWGNIPYPVNQPMSYPAFPFLCPSFMPPVPFCNFPPVEQQPEDLANTIKTNPFKLPDLIPSNVTGGVSKFIRDFNNLPENERVRIRQEQQNTTTVNQAILNSTGITSKGGLYKKGKVTNPFIQANFLTDSSPFDRFGSGIIVTNGNENGKVKGTEKKDIILGTANRNNIVDGRGGEDNIITSTKKDMINVHMGDQVSTRSDEDMAFFNFTESTLDVTRSTVVDGGEGKDVMVLTINGNPTLEDNIPKFSKLANGMISVTQNGVQLMTRNIERFIIADINGNVGSVYETTQQ